MPHGEIQRLLLNEYSDLDDTVLIESSFVETTRRGTKLQPLQIALTPTMFIIASRSQSADQINNNETKKTVSSVCIGSANVFCELRSMCPLNALFLNVFKHSKRQSLKAIFSNNKTRYFELEHSEKRMMSWKLWCQHVTEISNRSQIWPYQLHKNTLKPYSNQMRDSNEWRTVSRWTNKNLFLGSKRHAEDQDRPMPIPGLGGTEEQIQSYLLKAPCLDQLNDSNVMHIYNSNVNGYIHEVSTYTGEPTSNVTYTSIMTTVRSGSNDKEITRIISVIKFLVKNRREGACGCVSR